MEFKLHHNLPRQGHISENYTVIQHGSATLVFSCGGNDVSRNLFGPATRPCTVGSQANEFDMQYIIEFQPTGLYAFTGVHQKELADRTIPVELICTGINHVFWHKFWRDNGVSEQGLDQPFA